MRGSTIRQAYITMGTTLKATRMNDMISKHPMDGMRYTKTVRVADDIYNLNPFGFVGGNPLPFGGGRNLVNSQTLTSAFDVLLYSGWSLSLMISRKGIFLISVMSQALTEELTFCCRLGS